MHTSAPKRKKSSGRWPILGLVLTTSGEVLCNMLAERGANKSGWWGLGSSAAEWSMIIWRGTDATKSRDEECAPKSSVICTYSEGIDCVVRARRPTGETKSRDEECATKSSVVGTYFEYVVRVVHVDQRRGPCHLTAVVVAVVEVRALLPLRSHLRRNRGCGLDGKQKQNRFEEKKKDRLEERCHNSTSS